MKISEAQVFVCSPGRNFVTLKIVTDDGVTGLGDATLNGRELAFAAYLKEHVVPMLVGRDAHRIEDTWQLLYQGSYWRRGPVQMAAIAAVDTALWDIKGKVAGLPVYQLLGGCSRERVMVYGYADGENIDDALKDVAKYVAKGYKAVRVQAGVPEMPGTCGVSDNPDIYEPATAGPRPHETVWSTPRYLEWVPRVFAAVRKEFGPDLRLLHDVHHRLTPIEAARLGKSLEPYALTWMEDPVPAENHDGFLLIRQHTTTPIAIGEVFNCIWDCHGLITNHLIDYIRATVVHAGGLTHLRRIMDLAALHHVRSGCHGPTDLSPVCMAAAAHLGTAIANFGLQEFMFHTNETNRVFPHSYRMEAGHLYCGEEPGLGVEFDENEAAKYPYRQAYLPIARLEDGTLSPW